MIPMEQRTALEITSSVQQIRDRITAACVRAGRPADSVILLAATKTRTAQEIRTAIEAGIGAAGENRVQELRDKLAENAYAGCPLHFIGPLQTNKVKYLVGNVAMIHSVDSLRLAEAISDLSVKRGTVTNVLMEVNVGGEESKSGVAPADGASLADQIVSLPGLRLRGLMTVPPAVGDPRGAFASLRSMFERLAVQLPPEFDTLSMGMSHDFEIAVEEGATIVRVGSAIFGARAPKTGGIQ